MRVAPVSKRSDDMRKPVAFTMLLIVIFLASISWLSLSAQPYD
jgi:hypothetical protein